MLKKICTAGLVAAIAGTVLLGSGSAVYAGGWGDGGEEGHHNRNWNHNKHYSRNHNTTNIRLRNRNFNFNHNLHKFREREEEGAKGATGPAGPAGANGAKGAKGASGINGTNGATGPAGPPGVSGYETTFGPVTTVPSGTSIPALAQCSTGKSPLGGGWRIVSGTSPYYIVFNGVAPPFPDSWAAELYNSSPIIITYQAFAVCAKVS